MYFIIKCCQLLFSISFHQQFLLAFYSFLHFATVEECYLKASAKRTDIVWLTFEILLVKHNVRRFGYYTNMSLTNIFLLSTSKKCFWNVLKILTSKMCFVKQHCRGGRTYKYASQAKFEMFAKQCKPIWWVLKFGCNLQANLVR